MRYPVEIEEFPASTIEVEPPIFGQGAMLYMDGEPAPKGDRRNQYLMPSGDGSKLSVRLRPSLLYDVPTLEVEGRRIRVAPPLAWYKYLVSSLPLVLVLDGLVGVLIASWVIIANIRIFRSDRTEARKLALVVLLSIGVPIVYLLFGLATRLLSNITPSGGC